MRRVFSGRALTATAIDAAARLDQTACGGSSASGSGSGPIVVCEIAATPGPFMQLGEVGNDESNPATAAGLVRECVTRDNAHFVVGPEKTSTSSTALPVADSLHTVMLGWQPDWDDIGLSSSVQASQHQKIVVGGTHAYYFQRTPEDHGNITDTISAMQIVGADGSLRRAPVQQ
jgi:hypothetical protein